MRLVRDADDGAPSVATNDTLRLGSGYSNTLSDRILIREAVACWIQAAKDRVSVMDASSKGAIDFVGVLSGEALTDATEKSTVMTYRRIVSRVVIL